MRKKILLILLTISLLATACGAQFASAPESAGAPAPAVFEPAAEEVGGEEFGRSGDLASGLPQVTERLVIKNANLSLAVEDPGEALNQVASMAEEMGGFVVSSNLFQTQLESGVEVPRASVTVRVPAERLSEALTRLEGMALRVLSRSESGEDVTREYTDLQSRLRNLEAAEAQLQEIMASATKTEDVLSVFNQLTSIREQIEVIQGQIQFFEQSAAFSAVSVDLLADEAVQPLTIGGWQPVGVAKDALQALINTLRFLADALIWIALLILPLSLILLIPARLIGRRIRRWRERRQAARAQPPESPSE